MKINLPNSNIQSKMWKTTGTPLTLGSWYAQFERCSIPWLVDYSKGKVFEEQGIFSTVRLKLAFFHSASLKSVSFEMGILLGGGFKYFYFHPYLGKIPILTNIFRMG